MTDVRTIATTTHGRYLVEPAAGGASAIVVGFHGYAEPAEAQLERLKTLPAAGRFVIVSIQALSRFYRRRTQDVIASWMTRQDRELAIADNVAYVSAAIEAVAAEWGGGALPVVYAGFSQGASMAYRAACLSARPAAGLIALGGDIPPELEAASLSRIPLALLGRGARDEWYTQPKLDADAARLRAAGVEVRTVILDAGHEWTPEFSREAASFLGSLPSTRQPSAAPRRK
jgi:predicted esterase